MPELSMVGMNWGWGYSHNEPFFSLTGDWIVGEKQRNYIIDRYIVYGFKAKS